jgi:molybdopterin-biosynthesis enzyme MoeA-like protein
MPQTDVAAGREFGLIVIGDEILNGDRTDKHLPAFRAMLGARGHSLAWCWVLPDDPERLTHHLSASMRQDLPVFCCGGIGATPDDHTRSCAAAAAKLSLARHPEALRLIEGRFGEEAYPYRVLMADLPAGAALIPNPVNQIPGFSVHEHWFLPGFPKMAWPMAEWVLDHRYTGARPPSEAAFVVRDVPESFLIPIMRGLTDAHPGLKLFSLPHMADEPEDRYILLGFRGVGDLERAMTALATALDDAGIRYEPTPQSKGD